MRCSGLAQPDFPIFGTTVKQDREPKERKMTMFNSTHKLAAAAFGAAAIFSVISFSSNAEASQGPLSCHGSSAKKVMECCAERIDNSRPAWMIKTGRSCHTSYVATCKRNNNTFAAANLRCYLRPRPPGIFIKATEGGGNEGSSITGNPRGPNSPTHN